MSAAVDDSLAYGSAVEQARLVRGREITSVELTELYLRRIEDGNDRIGAYVTVAADHARAAARAADERLAASRADDSDDVPPFLGVPISVKDLSDTAGIRTTKGCRAWADRVPDADDEVVARIRRAGFVILGKTITPELGPLNVSEPPGYPPGRNPWGPRLSCGGSSGGAAASVAAGLAPLAHGSDGGGSIRNPSSWCGVFGLKPSRGRISDAPRSQQLFSTQGPIARHVVDAAALLDVLAGPATGDLFWAPPPATPYAHAVREPPPRLRVGWTARAPGADAAQDGGADPGLDVAPASAAAAEAVAMALAELGHDVAEVEPPGAGEDVVAAMATVMCAGYAAESAGLPPLDTLSRWTQTLCEFGQAVTAGAYVDGLHQLQTASRGVVARFGGDYDVLVTPTVAAPPPEVGRYADVDFASMPELWALTPFTGLWNTTGQPAVSVPWSFDDAGLPVGVQIVGPPLGEGVLLQLAAELESAHPWAHHRPPS